MSIQYLPNVQLQISSEIENLSAVCIFMSCITFTHSHSLTSHAATTRPSDTTKQCKAKHSNCREVSLAYTMLYIVRLSSRIKSDIYNIHTIHTCLNQVISYHIRLSNVESQRANVYKIQHRGECGRVTRAIPSRRRDGKIRLFQLCGNTRKTIRII